MDFQEAVAFVERMGTYATDDLPNHQRAKQMLISAVNRIQPIWRESDSVDKSDYFSTLHPNVQAILDAIAVCEGTDMNLLDGDRKGYDVIVGYAKPSANIAPGSDHPRRLVTLGPGFRSNAAGRYQFMSFTWDDYKVSGADFSPAWQDKIAVRLIQFKRQALDEVIAGNIAGALLKLSWEWASLPVGPWFSGQLDHKGRGLISPNDGRYGQATHKYQEFLSYYRLAGGQIAQ